MRENFVPVHGKLGSVPTESSLVEAWRQLLARHAATWCALERELGERHGLGVSEFEVLDRLVEAGEEPPRGQTLARDLYLSHSALSRGIGRLGRASLVPRARVEPDPR